MDFTHDKMCSTVETWQTVIEVHVDVKTTGGYFLPLFWVAFTKKKKKKAIIRFKDVLCSASVGLPNPEEDDGSYDLRGADK